MVYRQDLYTGTLILSSGHLTSHFGPIKSLGYFLGVYETIHTCDYPIKLLGYFVGVYETIHTYN